MNLCISWPDTFIRDYCFVYLSVNTKIILYLKEDRSYIKRKFTITEKGTFLYRIANRYSIIMMDITIYSQDTSTM